MQLLELLNSSYPAAWLDVLEPHISAHRFSQKSLSSTLFPFRGDAIVKTHHSAWFPSYLASHLATFRKESSSQFVWDLILFHFKFVHHYLNMLFP